MLLPVELDDELGCATVEIHNEPNLPPEFRVVKAGAAQTSP